MLKSTTIRLYLVAALIPATYLVARLVQAGLEPPQVELPNWTFREMPLQFDGWRGENTKLDPQIAAATGATIIVDRLYQDKSGRVVKMHTGMFKDPADGVFHSPINCYRSGGWQDLKQTRQQLRVSDDLTIPVSLSTWERRGERVLVVYWYQLGQHVLFNRWDLGLKIRWSLRGRSKWPALIKVMLETTATPDAEEAQSVLLGFAKQVAAWENQPQHRRQMTGTAKP